MLDIAVYRTLDLPEELGTRLCGFVYRKTHIQPTHCSRTAQTQVLGPIFMSLAWLPYVGFALGFGGCNDVSVDMVAAKNINHSSYQSGT